jgi:hypothetical protein
MPRRMGHSPGLVERLELHPIDPQTNGPQLLYGLRYHQQVVEPDEIETYHDQAGNWLWEPATGTIIQTLTIPRGQIAMAVGRAAPDAREFELVATRGLTTYGICEGFSREGVSHRRISHQDYYHQDGTRSTTKPPR